MAPPLSLRAGPIARNAHLNADPVGGQALPQAVAGLQKLLPRAVTRGQSRAQGHLAHKAPETDQLLQHPVQGGLCAVTCDTLTGRVSEAGNQRRDLTLAEPGHLLPALLHGPHQRWSPGTPKAKLSHDQGLGAQGEQLWCLLGKGVSWVGMGLAHPWVHTAHRPG